MTGMKSIEQPLITVAEALELSEHIKLSEMCIAMELSTLSKRSTARLNTHYGIQLAL